jgi:HJR/Mrr/RecB family endonuclease
MIITDNDLKKAKKFLEQLLELRKRRDFSEISPETFFWENPHLLIPLEFDDFYGIDWEMAQDYGLARPPKMVGLPHDYSEEYAQHVQKTFGLAELWFSGVESLYRDLGGSWYWFEGITEEGHLHFVGPKSKPNRYVSVDTWLEKLQSSLVHHKESPSRLWLPNVFSPLTQVQSNEALSTTIQPILIALKNEKKVIQDISWRTLEEIVAELLRAKGMKVEITKSTRDGGRDIIAKGEFACGEPMVIAVEVKQKSVVGLADVQRALKANEDFPSLMIVTSGRFSSGVIREKQDSRNQLRLFLKDGVALSQWIDTYPCYAKKLK